MEIKELLQQAEERMNKSIEALKHEFASIRTGRASVALLDKVMVDYYGSPSPINQVANISVPEPRMIVIAPWDKTMIGAIEKAILQSDLGLNPGNDGAQIRLTIPQLTEERRKEIVKVVHKKAEDAKVAVRNIQNADREQAGAVFCRRYKAVDIRLQRGTAFCILGYLQIGRFRQAAAERKFPQ